MCQRLTEKQKILKKLFSLHRFGIKPGLERTSTILDDLDNPHTKYPSIHIAGTNGKGSVSSMLTSILMEAGYKVGLYTSPHVFEFNERIRINKETISDDELCQYAVKVMEVGKSVNATFFEITTSIAFKYFFDNQVDIAVIEAGMGGRYDSTNVITPELSIITNVDLDHQEYLGDTIEKIAEEKAGIIKTNIPVVFPNFPKNIETIFHEKAEIESSKITSSTNCKINIVSQNGNLSNNVEILFDNLHLKNVDLSIPGKYQIDNVKLVISAAIELRKNYNISEVAIRNGIEKVKENSGLNYRIELIEPNRPIFVDVSHNPAAVQNLVETIRSSVYKDNKWQVIFGAMADKNIEEMLRLLKPITSNLVLTKASISRSEIPENLEMTANKLEFGEIKATKSAIEAVEFMLSNNKPTICLGSFYVIEEFMRAYLNTENS